jgi:hypothetical protein
VVVIVKLCTLDTELLDALVVGDGLHKLLEVLAVVEGDLDQTKTCDDLGRLAELNQPLHRSLHNLALFEPEVDDALVWTVFNGKEQVLYPNVVHDLDSDGDAFVVLRLDADCLGVRQILVVGEADVHVLTLRWGVLLLLVDFDVVLIVLVAMALCVIL